MTAALWERLELEPAEGRRLVLRQAAWVAAQATGAALLTTVGVPQGVALAVGVALGVVATRPARLYALPLVAMFVVAMTLLLESAGVPSLLAAGAAAGLAVGSGGVLPRVEAVLAGIAGGGLGAWAASEITPSFGVVGTALWVGAVVGVCMAQALLPGALRAVPIDRIPSPGTINATLQAVYRDPCMRAWRIDQEVGRQAPDRGARRGLGEVAGWVYRLALTLQTLDADLARIDPDAVRARRDALLGEADPGDPFVRERRQGTAAHLSRMLEHREALAVERARTESLQEYALAFLEEARTGLAVARVLPGDRTPENLSAVLDKLRAHAREGGARRQTARELEGLA